VDPLTWGLSAVTQIAIFSDNFGVNLKKVLDSHTFSQDNWGKISFFALLLWELEEF
jgi:hypothetical protein